MQFDWRALSGPLLTVATALIAFIVDRHLIAVPNPAPLFVCIVAFDDHFVLTRTDLDPELGFEQLEVLVERAEEAFGSLFRQGDLAGGGCGRDSVLLFLHSN